ncbi:hypothetical protein [uncultured Alistipes sp.]|uniref:acyltransferase n=1 Tax=uncultured Alistipes sp. TaxID=538949 RepID=UPI00262520F1|nr:hypothetical protein [uncultured Alistipes sp.]
MAVPPPSLVFRYGIYVLAYLPQIIWFNFHYLPWRQALRLPILLYKPRLKKCKGKIEIIGPVRTGMIRLGFPMVSIYPKRGISWEHRGMIRFRGVCKIGNNSFVSTGEFSRLDIGDNFCATTTLKLVCYHAITFGKNVLVGWENLFCDTDFHTFRYVEGTHSRGYAPIVIGDNNWLAMRSTILKGTITPNDCIVGANSLLHGDYSGMPEKSMIAGVPATLKKTGVYRDNANDLINYSI